MAVYTLSAGVDLRRPPACRPSTDSRRDQFPPGAAYMIISYKVVVQKPSGVVGSLGAPNVWMTQDVLWRYFSPLQCERSGRLLLFLAATYRHIRANQAASGSGSTLVGVLARTDSYYIIYWHWQISPVLSVWYCAVPYTCR